MEKGINGLNGEPQGSPYGRDRVAWWLRSPGNNDNNAACVFGENENVNDNGNNVKKEFGVRPALPDCEKCMESSMRQCIGQRNPVPFHRRHPGEKHMLTETADARAFAALGVGDDPFPRQPLKSQFYAGPYGHIARFSH